MSRRSALMGGAALVATTLAGCTAGSRASATPRPRQPLVPAALAKRPFTIAHRGGSADWPEESAFAYGKSAGAGVDALEMSVARTSDGVWFGSHDPTIDRLSQTDGFVIADHTWSEVQQHRIRPPATHPDQRSRPYLLLDDLIERYSASHSLWIDPKAAAAGYYPELIAMMRRHVPVVKNVFVAKSYATNVAWARLARSHQMESWGFYYGSELEADPQQFDETQQPWTMLGLDWDASAQWWRKFAADGRPVVAHVLTTKAQRAQSLARGARGLMIAGITEIIG